MSRKKVERSSDLFLVIPRFPDRYFYPIDVLDVRLPSPKALTVLCNQLPQELAAVQSSRESEQFNAPNPRRIFSPIRCNL